MARRHSLASSSISIQFLVHLGVAPPQLLRALEAFAREGAACRCVWAEVAERLGGSENLAETRYRRMKGTYRRRITKLGLLPDIIPLRLIVSEPRAISRLRGAA